MIKVDKRTKESSSYYIGEICIEDINYFAQPIHNEQVCGVYFLIKGESVVYVGQSTRGERRVFEHKDKEFDRYVFFPVDIEFLNWVEVLNILKYSPLYNKTHNKNGMVTIDKVNLIWRKLTGSWMDEDKIVKLGWDVGLSPRFYKNKYYYENEIAVKILQEMWDKDGI